MLSTWLNALRPPAAPVRRLAPGTVLWAFGDVHGRNDLLGPLLDLIQTDLEHSDTSHRIVVGLGDYVARGPDSRGVLDRLAPFSRHSELTVRLLRGNHEDLLEGFLDNPALGPVWCRNGGRAALKSYGVTPPRSDMDAVGWRSASLMMGAVLPPSHLELITGLAPSFSCGDYYFAHAGARPGVSLADQNEIDPVWIREEFTRSSHGFERLVVHGHATRPRFHMDHRRLCLDTGAYASGVLSAIRLEDDRRELLQVQISRGRVSADLRPLKP